VVDAAPPAGDDSGQIQELLEAAQGYAVFGRDGKRVGAFIELAGTGAKQIAIRHDGTFIWRRRVLPITAVAGVFPDERAVVLNVDRDSLAGVGAPEARVEARQLANETADSSEDVQRRIASYFSSAQQTTNQAPRDHEEAAVEPLESAELERPQPTKQGRPSGDAEGAGPRAARHLVFVSTSAGYILVELPGPPPRLGEGIEVPEQSGSFTVAKVGPSPLPNDPRICAYLAPIDR
jgi:hypothetical protein